MPAFARFQATGIPVVGALVGRKRPHPRSAAVATTEGEVMTLLIASNSMEQYRGTPFAPQLAASWRKLAAQLPNIVSFPGGRDAFSFKTFGTPKLDPAVFKILFRGRRRGLA